MSRKGKKEDFNSPGKAPLGNTGDSLYQNVTGAPADPKQNGPSAPESEGNVMYENMPFHRQGPVPSFPSARMRQSLPADFSRAYQNVLYCRQDYNPQQSQQQWNSSDQRWMSGGSVKREPCPQHGVVPDSPEWAEVLPHPRKNGVTRSDICRFGATIPSGTAGEQATDQIRYAQVYIRSSQRMKKADDLLPTSAECELEIKNTPQLHLSLEKMAPDSSDEMVYADLYDDVKAGKVPDPRMKPPLPPKGIGKKPKEPPLPPKTKKGGLFDSLGI
ncbi:uncharacterized protein CEXT_483801 [Caerostris extrusa]|uniref:Uncharacterized protein n=1 Tax=Caerostris extrusa TaxID=172846 RepID=A0AAV4N9Q7_CAEEX|nr:uncharacterized protein CEXT_483801 [Caerostris extrusa]